MKVLSTHVDIEKHFRRVQDTVEIFDFPDTSTLPD